MTEPQRSSSPENSFFEVLKDFVDAVRHDRMPVVKFSEMLHVQQMMEGIYRSAETGKEVSHRVGAVVKVNIHLKQLKHATDSQEMEGYDMASEAQIRQYNDQGYFIADDAVAPEMLPTSDRSYTRRVAGIRCARAK